jgi:hypothetical protein
MGELTPEVAIQLHYHLWRLAIKMIVFLMIACVPALFIILGCTEFELHSIFPMTLRAFLFFRNG